MSWKLIERGTFGATPPLEEGWVAIHMDGALTLRADDLASVGIEQFAAVLCDPGTLRIAVRKPKEHEFARATAVGVVRGKAGKDTGRRTIRATRAFRELCLDSRACAGRIELTTKDDLLILNLAGFEFDKGESADAAGTGRAKATVVKK